MPDRNISSEDFKHSKTTEGEIGPKDNLKEAVIETEKFQAEANQPAKEEFGKAEKQLESDTTTSKPTPEQQTEQPVSLETEKQIETLCQLATKNPHRAVELARELAKDNTFLLDRFHDTLVERLEQKDI